MEKGWIKIHRKLLEWEWAGVPEMVAMLVHLLFLANFEDKKWRGIKIKRGQLVTSIHSLSELVGISIKKVRTCLERMRNSGVIETKGTNRYTLITIVNYNKYQQNGQTKGKQNSSTETHIELISDTPENKEGKQRANKGQTKGKQRATTKEYKEYKEYNNINNNINNNIKNINTSEKEKINKKEKEFRRPTVEEVAEYCSSRGNSVDPETFVDFYTSKGWKVGSSPMKDWKAAVRTWEKRRPSKRGGDLPRKPESNFEVMKDMLERNRAQILKQFSDEQQGNIGKILQ